MFILMTNYFNNFNLLFVHSWFSCSAARLKLDMIFKNQQQKNNQKSYNH